MIAKRFYGPESHDVPRATGGTPLPAASLYVSPGMYSWRGQSFDMTAQGRYLLHDPLQATAQRIVHSDDLFALMSSFAWMVAYGLEHNDYHPSQLNWIALTSKLRLACNAHCFYTGYWLTWKGYPWRICRMHTAMAPNNYTDGHSGIEVRDHSGAWQYWDMNRGMVFKANGAILAWKDVVPLAGQLIDYLDCDVYAVETYTRGFDATAFAECFDRTANEKWALTERYYQIPGIDHQGHTYFWLPPGTEQRKGWLLAKSPHYRVISRAQWLAMFYPL